MFKAYLASLDVGTTGTRCALFNDQGQCLGLTYREYPLSYPSPGWVEQDPEALWRVTLEVAQEAFQKAQIAPHQVVALGITNQRETIVAWDIENDRPLYPAIVWQDRRTSPRCQQIKEEGLADRLKEKTGLPPDPYFSATKIEWLLKNVPEVRHSREKGTLRFGTVDSWILYRLTGCYATDMTNASRTLLFNLTTLSWDEELLEFFSIPEFTLPPVYPSAEASGYGVTRRHLLGAAIPVTGVIGDQQSALVGQVCFEPGTVKNTYGTGCFLLMNTGSQIRRSSSGLLTTVAYALPNQVFYALEGSIFVTGAAVQWLRDGLGILQSSAEIEALARSVPDNGGVYFVPAFTGLGAPYWDPEARGLIIGLTRGTHRGHLARAVLEAIAYQTRDVLERMEKEAGLEIQDLRIDGGAVRNDLLCQIQADLLGKRVLRPVFTETTALGSAYIAGLGIGLWRTPQELFPLWKVEKSFEPLMEAKTREGLYLRWKEAVKRSLGWERRE